MGCASYQQLKVAAEYRHIRLTQQGVAFRIEYDDELMMMTQYNIRVLFYIIIMPCQ